MKNLPFYLLIISNYLLSQEIIINSEILSNDNLPLQHANITCDDTYAISDNNGDFIIRCKETSNIFISHIGYKQYQINPIDMLDTIILESISIACGGDVFILMKRNGQKMKTVPKYIIHLSMNRLRVVLSPQGNWGESRVFSV